MPELPEVEVARQGVARYVEGNRVANVMVHGANLRWPVSAELVNALPGLAIVEVARRGKYLVFKTSSGGVLIHLGMTGYVRMLPEIVPPAKHDHVDFLISTGEVLRFNDPRRFGSVLWTDSDPQDHRFISGLGPEPLTEAFSGAYLYEMSRGKGVPVKQFLMGQKVVAGIGNIYANETLFHAGIKPLTEVGRLSKARCERLAKAIKMVLLDSISNGGTMLDFRDGIEKWGQFNQALMVYDREGKPCKACGSSIQRGYWMKRSIFFCKTCQH